MPGRPATPADAPPAVLYLRAHRQAAGMSMAGLARAVGVPRSTLYDHENGTAHGISFVLLGALAHALGVAPGALFAPPGTPKPPKGKARAR